MVYIIDLSTLDICFWTRGRGYLPPTFLRAPTLSEILQRIHVFGTALGVKIWTQQQGFRLPGGDCQDEGFFVRVPKYETSPRKGVGFYR